MGGREKGAGVSFTVAAGEICALLGRAGSGKTAVLEAVAGLRRPVSGSVRVRGADPYGDREGLRLGAVWREGGDHAGFTVEEVAESYRRWTLDPLTTAEALELTGLGDLAAVRFERLTAGQRRLLDLALALLNRSDVLFLDDPLAGLDSGTVERIWTVLRDVAGSGAAILFSTRSLAEASRADRTSVVDEGRACPAAPPPRARAA
ncbi:ATP-binding cassette domain-containing protein [Actinomadura meyerae]|uniref:ATP-binding cassette domain-containing protein n=1 Tax=Actinomadura meyerae TaxID=240840 RepID=UPI001FE68736|nr:ATP-binding cassette domain-containing protein [Actinomadura meyerae]